MRRSRCVTPIAPKLMVWLTGQERVLLVQSQSNKKLALTRHWRAYSFLRLNSRCCFSIAFFSSMRSSRAACTARHQPFKIHADIQRSYTAKDSLLHLPCVNVAISCPLNNRQYEKQKAWGMSRDAPRGPGTRRRGGP